MPTLDDVTTADLIEALSTREGVERIDVAPYKQTVEIAVCEDGTYPYDRMTLGPCIILKIID